MIGDMVRIKSTGKRDKIVEVYHLAIPLVRLRAHKQRLYYLYELEIIGDD